MSNLERALGGFSPFGDVHAALKFGLMLVVKDRRFAYLSQLLTDGERISEIVGEPGYSLERRVHGEPSQASWPAYAMFRAFVEPDEYPLEHPEGFYSREEFSKYVLLAVNAYAAGSPSCANEVEPVLRALEGR